MKEEEEEEEKKKKYRVLSVCLLPDYLCSYHYSNIMFVMHKSLQHYE